MYVFEYLIYHLKPYGISSKLVLPHEESPASKYKAPSHDAGNKTQSHVIQSKNKASIQNKNKASSVASSPTPSTTEPVMKADILKKLSQKDDRKSNELLPNQENNAQPVESKTNANNVKSDNTITKESWTKKTRRKSGVYDNDGFILPEHGVDQV